MYYFKGNISVVDQNGNSVSGAVLQYTDYHSTYDSYWTNVSTGSSVSFSITSGSTHDSLWFRVKTVPSGYTFDKLVITETDTDIPSYKRKTITQDTEFPDKSADKWNFAANKQPTGAGDPFLFSLVVHLKLSAPATVTVTFDARGGSVSPSSRTFTVGATYNDGGGLPTPTKTGNNFGGWFSDSSLTSSVSSSDPVSASVTTLYAKWTALSQYTITFSANGGPSTPSPITFYAGSSVTMPSTSWSEHTFLGWSTSSGATSATYRAGYSYSFSGSTTLYAVWQHVTVTFNANGGSVSPSTKSYVIGSAYGSFPTPAYTGYSFTGWYTSQYGGNKVKTSTIATATQTTLYAHWERVITYTIVYNDNGGSGGPGSQTSASTSVYLSYTQPTWSGRTFRGWSLTGGDPYETTSPVYAPGDRITVTAETTYLYAKWTANPFTVTLNANGGKFPAEKGGSESTVKYLQLLPGDTYGAGLTDPMRDGYYFVGWYYQNSIGGGKRIVGSSTVVQQESAHTLIAQWASLSDGKVISYSTSSYGETGHATGLVTTTGCVGGAAPTVTGLPAHVKLVAVGCITCISARVEFFERQEQKDYMFANRVSGAGMDVTYGLGGSTVRITGILSSNLQSSDEQPLDALMLYMNETTLKQNSQQPYGWLVFNKLPWIKSGDAERAFFKNMDRSMFRKGPVVALHRGDGYWYEEGYPDLPFDSTLIVPLAIDISYLVLFNPNGGEMVGTTFFKRVYYGDAYGELPKVTHPVYEFAGWYTEETGGTRIYASSTFQQRSDQTLYAHWTATTSTHTLTFNANGGTVSPASRTLAEGATYGTLPTPKRSGYTFVEWRTDPFLGNRVTSSTKMGTDDVTVYAIWRGNSITITLNANGGTVSPTAKNVENGSVYGILPRPTRSGFIFDGWWTSATGGTKILATDKPSASQTIYAHWKQDGGEVIPWMF